MENVYNKSMLKDIKLLRECCENGLIYCVEGDYDVLPEYDECDCPVVDCKLHLFTNKDDANKYANSQCWPFNNEHPCVRDLRHELSVLNCEDEFCNHSDNCCYDYCDETSDKCKEMEAKLVANKAALNKLASQAESLAAMIKDLELKMLSDGAEGCRPELPGCEDRSDAEVLEACESLLADKKASMRALTEAMHNISESLASVESEHSCDDSTDNISKFIY